MREPPRFEAYLAQLPFDDPAAAATGIRSWEELAKRLDDDRQPPLQPPPRRRPVAPQRLRLSWRYNLRAAVRSRAPAAAAPGWQKVVEYRQRVSLALTIATTGSILALSNMMLTAQQMPAVTRNLYLIVYGLMTFFLAANFFKMTLGTWYMLRGARSNRWHPSHTACEPSAGTRGARCCGHGGNLAVDHRRAPAIRAAF